MIGYKLFAYNGETVSVTRSPDNVSIPLDPANTDYQAYLEWVDEGNTAEEAS